MCKMSLLKQNKQFQASPVFYFWQEFLFLEMGNCADLQTCVRDDPQKRAFVTVGRMSVSKRLV